MAREMNVMFAMEPMEGDDSGMKAAKELDMAEDDSTMAASPTVTIKARTVKALQGALNKAMTAFGQPEIMVEAKDLKGEPLPLELIKGLQMINAAYEDYSDEPAVSFEAMVDDKGALIEIAKLGKVLGDKGFLKFLKSEALGEETMKPSAPKMEMEEEDMEEDDMMMRMS